MNSAKLTVGSTNLLILLNTCRYLVYKEISSQKTVTRSSRENIILIIEDTYKKYTIFPQFAGCQAE